MEYKKKLIEVALPLETINKACVKEKSIRHGHPSTFHPYWARRPLAATRALLIASLIDDPSENSELSENEIIERRDYLFDLIKKTIQWADYNLDENLKKVMVELEKNNTKLPSLLDPFSGGGTIPLEAQKLGLKAYGSDLNPLSVLITKGLIEIRISFMIEPTY